MHSHLANRGDRDRAPGMHVQLSENYVQDDGVDEDVFGYAGLGLDDDSATLFNVRLPQFDLRHLIGEESESIEFGANLHFGPPSAQDKVPCNSAQTRRLQEQRWTRLMLARPLHVGRAGVEDNTNAAELEESNGHPESRHVFEAFALDSDVEEKPPSLTYAVASVYSDWEVEPSARTGSVANRVKHYDDLRFNNTHNSSNTVGFGSLGEGKRQLNHNSLDITTISRRG